MKADTRWMTTLLATALLCGCPPAAPQADGGARDGAEGPAPDLDGGDPMLSPLLRAVDQARYQAVYVYEMIGYRSAEPGSQAIPTGFGLLFPKQVERIGDNGNRGDFIAVVTDGASQAAAAHFERVGEAQGLPVVTLPVPENLKNSPILQDLRRSDHASFWAASFPALMITDTANFRNTHYHCSGGPDSAERIDGAFATQVIRAAVGSALELLKGP